MKLDKQHLYTLFDKNFKRFQYSRVNHLNIYFNTPCIYLLLNKKEVVYIGQSKCLMQRLTDHYRSDKVFDNYVFFIYKGTDVERLEQESKLIFYFNPIYNINFPYYIKEAYLKSFYKHSNVYYKYDNYLHELEEVKKEYKWQNDLESCITLLEQNDLNKSIIYSNDQEFIRMFKSFCMLKTKKATIIDYQLIDLWEKLYVYKEKFNFTLVYKNLNDFSKTIKV